MRSKSWWKKHLASHNFSSLSYPFVACLVFVGILFLLSGVLFVCIDPSDPDENKFFFLFCFILYCFCFVFLLLFLFVCLFFTKLLGLSLTLAHCVFIISTFYWLLLLCVFVFWMCSFVTLKSNLTNRREINNWSTKAMYSFFPGKIVPAIHDGSFIFFHCLLTVTNTTTLKAELEFYSLWHRPLFLGLGETWQRFCWSRGGHK